MQLGTAARLAIGIAAVVVAPGCGFDASNSNSGPQPAEIVESAPSPDEMCDLPDASRGPPPLAPASLMVETEPLCRLVAIHVATLSPSPSGDYPDPGVGRILYHERGILTNVARHMGAVRGSLLLWGHDGSFLEVIGAPGEGPGEFGSNFTLHAYSGPDRQVYVSEGQRWSVLDSTLAFVRVINSPHFAGFWNDLLVTGDGGYIQAGNALAGDGAYWYHRFDAAGQFVRSFGPRAADGTHGALGLRQLAPAEGDAAFWAGPPGGAPEGYVLEQWSVTGDLVRTLERDVPWVEPTRAATAGRDGVPNFQLHDDGQGLLWVTSWAFREGVDPAEAELSEEPTDEERRRVAGMYQQRLDVIDPADGQLVAAAILDSPAPDGSELPLVPVQGARITARYVVDGNGFRSIELFDWYLVRP